MDMSKIFHGNVPVRRSVFSWRWKIALILASSIKFHPITSLSQNTLTLWYRSKIGLRSSPCTVLDTVFPKLRFPISELHDPIDRKTVSGYIVLDRWQTDCVTGEKYSSFFCGRKKRKILVRTVGGLSVWWTRVYEWRWPSEVLLGTRESCEFLRRSPVGRITEQPKSRAAPSLLLRRFWWLESATLPHTRQRYGGRSVHQKKVGRKTSLAGGWNVFGRSETL